MLEWELGGHTTIDNVVMVCRQHHRLIHHSGWEIRIRDGLPEFLPPAWIDPTRRPRHQPGSVIDVPQPRRSDGHVNRKTSSDDVTGVRVADFTDLVGARTP